MCATTATNNSPASENDEKVRLRKREKKKKKERERKEFTIIQRNKRSAAGAIAFSRYIGSRVRRSDRRKKKNVTANPKGTAKTSGRTTLTTIVNVFFTLLVNGETTL